MEANDHDVEDESSFDKKAIEQCSLQPQINIEPRVSEVLESPTSSLIIGSILDTPKKVALKKELFACKRLLTVKNHKLSNLRKQNKRLKKKYNNLKDVLSLLNKRQIVDQSLLHDLSKHIEVTDTFNAIYLKNVTGRKRPFSQYPPGVDIFSSKCHDNNHRVITIKSITERYLKVRLHYIAKKDTEKK
ncbi:unnamed protein product [Parnassius apollo]|uniref:(apollo) hypothetical protein n=1 Tax=Parnassius apollo TaxID=110799 RepID=A0A8S3XK55_PARAO|nr:unnamed protein product [Parnassius apollo]